MLKRDRLFYLIKSLSASEKRYFRLLATAMKTKSNYLLLFDTIDRQDVPDDHAIRRQFAKHAFSRQLHVAKNYLRHLIMKSLRIYHADLSQDAKVKNGIRNIEILFNRDLHSLCREEIDKAEKLAREYELFPALFEILSWKRRIMQTEHPHAFEAFNDIIQDQSEVLQKMHNCLQYYELIIDLSQYVRSTNSEIRNLTLIEEAHKPASIEARVLHHNAAYFWNIAQGKPKAMLPLVALIDFFERHPHIITEDPGLFASSMNNLISYYIFNRNYDLAVDAVQRARKHYVAIKLNRENITLFKQVLRTYSLELEIYRDASSVVSKGEAILQVASFIEKQENKIPALYLVAFWFQLANLFFLMGRFKDALKWVNPLLELKHKAGQLALFTHARFLNLMIHFELNNLFVLRYFVESTRRFVKKNKQLEPYQKKLLRFFLKISRTAPEDYQRQFHALIPELDPNISDTGVPDDALDYIDYLAWATAHAGLKNKIQR